MTQRKLTEDEVKELKAARSIIERLFVWEDNVLGHDHWQATWHCLFDMALYGTNDGRPWIETEGKNDTTKTR